jgi:DNA (cytosine-5)-methyltransferase 1
MPLSTKSPQIKKNRVRPKNDLNEEMNKYKLLDLFCCAGGAAKGYSEAGFEVMGVDKNFQKRYPYEFIQGDALEYLENNWNRFDAFHASPPCQHYSELTPKECRENHPDLIAPVRSLLVSTGKPYIIENVPGARRELVSPVMLCGSMFGLKTHRHRFFEIGFDSLVLTPPCKHDFIPIVVSGTTKRLENGRRREHTADECRRAMNIDWMIRKELDQAIPPAYTKFLGGFMINHLNNQQLKRAI